MSESQTIDGVTITHKGGGFYELNHPSLAAPEKVRGKEVADARAKEIAAAAVVPEGHIPPQPPLPDTPPAIDAAPPPAVPDTPPVATVTVSEGAAPEPPSHVPAGVPREFTGTMEPEAQQALGVPMTRIILDDSPDIPPTGLFVQHNFRPYMIVTGVPVDVPDFLLGVLNDAVISLPVVDPKSQKVMGYRDRMKYPYRRVT